MLTAAFLLTTLLGSQLLATPTETVHQRLTIKLDPERNRIQVISRLLLPESLRQAGSSFLLASALRIEEARPAVEAVEPVVMKAVPEAGGINGSGPEGDSGKWLTRYRLVSEAAEGRLTLSYAGPIDFGLSDQKEEYTRGFRETHGIVGKQGVYLSGSGHWYPAFGDELLTFEADISMPADWHVISQGEGSSGDGQGRARWKCTSSVDEIYLVGGPLLRYQAAAGAVQTLVYLHEQDDALADRYLSATAQYIEMFRNLIGPYPYEKFALVENFWETGYGMPSFTLLGPTVIRFPFILHSSYPHEILHNWWGNSVFVDYEQGNWCEGLTAYMADHLIQEQRGLGAAYRRSSLQKYRDYVKAGRDFPLAEFRSRHSAATEAVGYGKALMGFHMLRQRYGDDVFRSVMASFFRSQKGRRATFDDIRQSFESVVKEDLAWFFDQWVQRAGAAALQLTDARSESSGDGWVLTFKLAQTQAVDPFILDVPVLIHTATGSRVETVRLSGREAEYQLSSDVRPLGISVDPGFDLFRHLDPRETPASIGQIFGDEAVLAILPSAADADRLEQYRQLMEGWRTGTHQVRMQLDSEVDALPADRAVWILGFDNRFASTLFAPAQNPGLDWNREQAELLGEAVVLANHSLVVVRRHPGNLERALGWLVVEPAAAFPGMARKLPHYGKYSYLAFEGEEPTNVVKGQWPAADSPLSVDLRDEGDRAVALEVQLERTALAELPPAFSMRALEQHVAYLASPELEGRGVGTPGLDLAGSYIAREFAAAGLDPGGENGGWYQEFVMPTGPDGQPHTVRNVIGVLRGANPQFGNQSAVVSAHYDHLGRGWPDVHQGDEGQIHPGADDNASGVAVLIELARNLAQAAVPSRNLVFVAFTAEEAGLLGSRHFAEHPQPFPLEGLLGVINIDTVGRLGQNPLSILGTGTADEWQHIFRGCGFVTGVECKNVPGSTGGSDQNSFIAKGVPGVQIFAQAHADYHRPGDTLERVDLPGLVRVATFVKEAVVYLGEREDPLTITIDDLARQQAAPLPTRPGRGVRFGSVPDYAHPGPGVLLEAVGDDTPASRAGLLAGDLLIALDGEPIADLRAFSEALRGYAAGQTVSATVERAGQKLTLAVTLEAR